MRHTARRKAISGSGCEQLCLPRRCLVSLEPQSRTLTTTRQRHLVESLAKTRQARSVLSGTCNREGATLSPIPSVTARRFPSILSHELVTGLYGARISTRLSKKNLRTSQKASE